MTEQPTPERGAAMPAQRRRRSRLWLAAPPVAAAVVMGFASGAQEPQAPDPDPVEAVVAAPAPTVEPVAATPRRARAVRAIDPATIEIPAIGVDAPVIDLGLTEDGELEVPTDFDDTGWWTGGSRPGAAGPAVIAGHVDSLDGPAVFHRLPDLEPGDDIHVLDEEGNRVTYVVTETEQHPKDDFPTDKVYRSGGPWPTLRLITCGGDFDRAARSYRDNVIVFARLAI